MDVKRQDLVVDTSPVDSVHGAQPEIEERPAQSVILSAASLHMSAGGGGMSGPAPTIIGPDGKPLAVPKFEDSVIRLTGMKLGDVVANATKQCHGCVYFNNRLWRDTVRPKFEKIAKLDKEMNRWMNLARKSYVESENDTEDFSEDSNVEEGMGQMGVCMAYQNLLERGRHADVADEFVVHPLASCPTEDGDTGEKLPRLYRAKGSNARGKEELSLFDKILMKVKKATK